MNQQFETAQKFSKDGIEATMKSLGALSRGVQTAAVDVADYAKRSFEHTSSTVEKLAGARSLDKVMEIQTDFIRSAYEGFVGQATKMGEMATATAKDVMAPMEGLAAKNPMTASA